LENDIKTTEFANHWVIVMFYNPTCPHCKELFPVFEQFAAEHYQQNSSDIFVKLNGIEYSNVVELYNVDSFPSVQMFFKGKQFGRTMPLGFSKNINIFRTFMQMQMNLGGLAQKFATSPSNVNDRKF